MGNTQSAEGPRRTPHKLSKPRVGNPASGPTAPPTVNASGPFSNSYLVGSLPLTPVETSNPIDATTAEADVSGNTGEVDPAPTRRPSRRDSARLSGLFRSKSAVTGADRKRRSIGLADRPTDGVIRANSVAHLAVEHSGTDSSLQVPRPRGSVHYDLSSYEASRLLNLSKDGPQEHPLPSQENSLDVHEVTETAWRNMPLQPTAKETISRANSDLSLYAPMRRRSIVQTPGVATRFQAPTAQVSAKSSFRHSHPPTPSDSRSNSIDASVTRHLSLPPRPDDWESPARVSTPCEADYKQLGGMRFGSLRIMNGAPVPSPGAERHIKHHRAEAPSESPTKHHSTWSTPLSSSSGADISARETEPEEKTKHLKPRPADLKIMNSSSDDARTGKESPADYTHNLKSPRPISSSTTSKLVSSGPAPLDLGSLWDLQTTSKLSEHDDNLFEDDGDTPGSETPDDYKTEPETRGNMLEASRKAATVVVERPLKGLLSASSQTSRVALSHVDSGYGSIASRRSDQEQSQEPKDTNLRVAAPPSNRQSFDIANQSELKSSNTAQLGPKNEALLPANETASPVDEDDATSDALKKASPSLSRAAISSLLRTNKAGEPQASPRPDAHSRSQSVDDRSSPANSEGSLSRQSSGKSSHKRGKLFRLLSRRKSMPTPYATHDVSESVPSIPSNMEDKLREHNGRFPTAPKRLALRVEPSKETLNTIMSVESGDIVPTDVPAAYEAKHELARAPEPVPVPVSVPPSAPKQRRRSLQTMSNSFSHASRNLMNRRSSQGMKDKSDSWDMDYDGPDGIQEYEAQVASMDSIRHIMGNSAFDQAFIAMATDPASPSAAAKRSARARLHHLDALGPTPPRPLKSTASAPNLSEVDSDVLGPLMPGFFPQRNHRPAPPVSFRTRSSKKSRSQRPSPSRSQTTPDGQPIPSWAAPSRPQSQGGLAPSHRGGPVHPSLVGYPMAPTHHSVYGQPPPHRISYDGYGSTHAHASHSQVPSQDQWIHEQQYGAKSSNQYRPRRHTAHNATREQRPPFRVLHSYNSPAYKGVPIWG